MKIHVLKNQEEARLRLYQHATNRDWNIDHSIDSVSEANQVDGGWRMSLAFLTGPEDKPVSIEFIVTTTGMIIEGGEC